MSTQKQNIVLLGAGITSLQTALSLLTSAHANEYQITIIAEHTPGDLATEYTSPWAGGHWRTHSSSSPSDLLARKWDSMTYAYWLTLLRHGDDFPGTSRETTLQRTQRIGLGIVKSKNYWCKVTEEIKDGESGVWWRDVVEGFRVLGREELEVVGKGKVVFGVEYDTVCINVPRYLKYLEERIVGLGARIIKRKIDTGNKLPGAIKHINTLLEEQTPPLPHSDILINCTGLSARHLVTDIEKEKLSPVRGQTVLVKGEAKEAVTVMGFGKEDEIAYVLPRPGSGATILGGSKEVGVFDARVDGGLEERILGWVEGFGMAEELRGVGGKVAGEVGLGGVGSVDKEKDKGFQILSSQVGFRPGRKGGVRLEVDEQGKVEGAWVLHCYGHSGAGYQNSVGCAEGVVGLVERLLLTEGGKGEVMS